MARNTVRTEADRTSSPGLVLVDRYGMDLIRAASTLQQARTLAEVQVRVARKILDTQRMQGNAAVKLIEAAGRGASQAGDALVAQATGLGGMIDTYA